MRAHRAHLILFSLLVTLVGCAGDSDENFQQDSLHVNQYSLFGYCQQDSDQDGWPDDEDNCPDTVNRWQRDADHDGIGDACDNCPRRFNLGQADTDNDNVGDLCDNCPEHPNPEQIDTDSDGVGDACDNCIIDYNPGQEEYGDRFIGGPVACVTVAPVLPCGIGSIDERIVFGPDPDGDGIENYWGYRGPHGIIVIERWCDNCPWHYNRTQTSSRLFPDFGVSCEPRPRF